MNKKILAALMLIVVAGSFGIAGSMFSIPAVSNEQTFDGVKYTTNVCSTVYRHNPDGTYTQEPSYCTHNLMTNAGKMMVKNFMRGSSAQTNNISAIAVSNSTAPVVGDTTLAGMNLLGDCGLANITAINNQINATAWDLSWQWTSSCNNQIVNTTAIFNSTAAGNVTATSVAFAAATLTSSTLQATDKIQVNYTINVG